MTGLRRRHRFGLANSRFSGISVFKAVCLVILPTFPRTQALPPCATGTIIWTVNDTKSATNLSALLQCSSGTFDVNWIGEVVVTETVYVAEGTSLTITGAESGAIADGDNSAQLFFVDGASSLHLTDMMLANGVAPLGGAVYAVEKSTVSWSGETSFTANTANTGGAIYVHFSTVYWDGNKTVFSSNEAFASRLDGGGYGGAITADHYSNISWDGDTVFTNNTAKDSGGGLFVTNHSSISSKGITVFLKNYAQDGAGVAISNSSIAFWDGQKVFTNNEATNLGGGLFVTDHSKICCTGNTTFVGNSAKDGAGVVINEYSNGSWDGETLFANNEATYWGAALYVNDRSIISCNGTTIVSENSAQTGAGVVIYGYSSGSWEGETIFTKNEATHRGGALIVNDHSSTSCNGNTTFLENIAQDGAGVMIYDYSFAFWDGEKAFTNNKATNWGGGLFVTDHSKIICTSNTTFLENSAQDGAGVAINEYSNGSWEGETIFTKNEATHRGGALIISDYSSTSCNGNTIFSENVAQEGAGVRIFDFSSSVWSGTTAFTSNRAYWSGGGLNVHTSSDTSWAGTMTFSNNIADKGGAIMVWDSDASWTGTTTFADNIAESDGGALYAILTYSLVWDALTTFRNNTATQGDGGALGLYGSHSTGNSTVRCSSQTTFTNNRAFVNGGAVLSSANKVGLYFEEATFEFNSARVGGAIATFGTGNGDEVTPLPSEFVRCIFSSNTATETGGAVESAFGQDMFRFSYFKNNFADMGGALRLGGTTVILRCSFIANSASSLGPAIAVVGSVDISYSKFDGNSLYCEAGEFLEYSDKGELDVTRFETICDGCSSESCSNCTIENADHVPQCSNALENTRAGGRGTELETLNVSAGYWRVSNQSINILECYNKLACPGGLTGAACYCNKGYTGPYCAVCQAEYSPSLGATCTWCSSTRRRGLVVAAVIVVIVVVCAMVVFSAYLVSTDFEERETCCLHRRIFKAVPLQAFKIVVVVWQILTQFASVANVTYPAVYQTFLSVIDVINLDLGFIYSAGCLWSGIDFHDRLLVVTIGPLVITGFLALTYAVALNRNSMSDVVVVRKIRNKHLSALLLLSFLVYSSVSSSVFQMFACDSLDNNVEYLRADYRLLCTNTKHKALQVYAGIMIAVYPVGIPLLYAIVLYRYRDILTDSKADKARAQPIADLWAPYRPERYYYEVVECGRRLMLTGVIVFVYPNDAAQIAITFLISLFFFAVSEASSPFESRSDMWLSRGGHVIVLLSVFDVLLLKVKVSHESSESQRMFGRVLVAGHVLMFLTIVVESIGICYAARRLPVVVVEENFPRLRSQRPFVDLATTPEGAPSP